MSKHTAIFVRTLLKKIHCFYKLSSHSIFNLKYTDKKNLLMKLSDEAIRKTKTNQSRHFVMTANISADQNS